MRISYSHSFFCFLVALCPHWVFFPLFFLSVTLIWWYSMIFPPFSFLLLLLCVSFLDLFFVLWIRFIRFIQKKVYIYIVVLFLLITSYLHSLHKLTSFPQLFLLSQVIPFWDPPGSVLVNWISTPSNSTSEGEYHLHLIQWQKKNQFLFYAFISNCSSYRLLFKCFISFNLRLYLTV